MFENFDDLFDKFFGDKGDSYKGKDQPKSDKTKKLDNLFNELMDELKNQFESDNEFSKMKELANKLNNFEDLHGDHMDNPHEKELGEPDEIITFEQNGYVFEKKIWNLKHGQMIKVNMVITPYDADFDPVNKKKLSLEEKLEIALQEERYEDAAKIRDEIQKRDSEPKKVEEDKPQQTQGDVDDEWNF